jgi:hypothetical protein
LSITPAGKTSLAEKLALLLKIVERADSANYAVSLEEIVELLLDLGTRLQNGCLNSQRNAEVFEDPQDRPDALGNVTMFHRSQRVDPQEELLQDFGEALTELAHRFYAKARAGEQSWKEWTEVVSTLDMYDDARSWDLLAAKRLVSKLRRENEKLDRRNEKLFLLLEKSKRKTSKLSKLLLPKSDFHDQVRGMNTKRQTRNLSGGSTTEQLFGRVDW